MIVRYGMRALVLLGAAFLLTECSRERATRDQCRTIFDRIVAIELEEMGYSDPALATRTKKSLAARYQSEIQDCVGRALPSNALECVATAASTEELSHECL